MTMRYIIHLLPEESSRTNLDELRERLADQIGRNKALDYPTAHVTLVQNIQDEGSDEDPIDGCRLASVLETVAGSGSIQLRLHAPGLHGKDVLMTIGESPPLTTLRRRLVEATRAVVSLPEGGYADRAAKVKEQDWPHLTLAQEIGLDQARQAMAYLAENWRWEVRPVLATEVALLARDLDRDEPYRIINRVAL